MVLRPPPQPGGTWQSRWIPTRTAELQAPPRRLTWAGEGRRKSQGPSKPGRCIWSQIATHRHEWQGLPDRIRRRTEMALAKLSSTLCSRSSLLTSRERSHTGTVCIAARARSSASGALCTGCCCISNGERFASVTRLGRQTASKLYLARECTGGQGRSKQHQARTSIRRRTTFRRPFNPTPLRPRHCTLRYTASSTERLVQEPHC